MIQLKLSINIEKIFKIYFEKDNGIYSAINKGIKLATGDIISVLHSDDFILMKRFIV